jgi:hypothetical protein
MKTPPKLGKGGFAPLTVPTPSGDLRLPAFLMVCTYLIMLLTRFPSGV